MSDVKSQVHVEFFVKPVENADRTKTEGRPIFEDGEFVRIKFPGDKHRIHVAPAHEVFRRDRSSNEGVTYAMEYPKHYEAFKAGHEQIGDGTPLGEYPMLTEAKRAELRAINIHTVEQLAGMTVQARAKYGMGAMELQNGAKAWLDKAAGSADVLRMQREMDELRAQIAALSGSPAPQVSVEAEPANDQWSDFTDDDLKNMIADATGARPKGNPKRDTLVRTLDEIAAAKAKAA